MSAASLLNTSNAANGLFPINVASVTMPNSGATLTTASTGLNYYSTATQASHLVPITFSGPWASPLARYASICRIGPIVFLKLDNYSGTATVTAAATGAAGSIPAEFCPTNTALIVTSVGTNDGDEVELTCDLYTDGTIVFSPVGALTFTGSGVCQFGETVLSWMVN